MSALPTEVSFATRASSEGMKRSTVERDGARISFFRYGCQVYTKTYAHGGRPRVYRSGTNGFHELKAFSLDRLD